MTLQQLQKLKTLIQQQKANDALNRATVHVKDMQQSNNQQYNLINGDFVLTEINNYKQPSEDLLNKFDDLINQLINTLEQNL